jgi:Spy/CpxP family protein refolding chaperone
MKAIRTLLALAVAAPLAAQQPDSAKKPAMPMGHQMGQMMGPGMMQGRMMEMQGMMGQMMGHMSQMMGPMMRGMGYMPEHLLMKKDQLQLTAQQVTRLTALRDAGKTAHDAAHADAKTHMDALRQVLQANAPDTTALRQHFQAAHSAMGNAHLAMLRATAQAKAVLNDAQRGRVEGWMDAMEHMGPMTHMRRAPGDSGHEGNYPNR